MKQTEVSEHLLDARCLVLDIGKTNIKLHVLSASGDSLYSVKHSNTVMHDGVYPHADVDGIWYWVMSQLPELAQKYHIESISITTHGATAALINGNVADRADALVLPVLDYEFDGVAAIEAAYRDYAPNFSESYSPALPAGLNLGRQLYWQSQTFPEAFEQTTHIIMYPQYWAWRLSGVFCSEVTSLGCHTDLWRPAKKTYSSLVDKLNWRHLFPGLKKAWESIGKIDPEVARSTGLSSECKIFAGVHDSNASFLRYKRACQGMPFTVISTGTWTILMSSSVSLKRLDPQRDMLANVDVESHPIACARFMGGREFEIICERLGGQFGDVLNESLLAQAVDTKAMALPDFSGGSGPFGCASGEFLRFNEDLEAQEGIGVVIATLYCALMMDYQLDQLFAKGDIFIEGAFLQNPILCRLLAAFRVKQALYLSADSTGTVQGCAQLTRWHNSSKGKDNDMALELTQPLHIDGLDAYRTSWRKYVESKRA